jgi:hypothetical protein
MTKLELIEYLRSCPECRPVSIADRLDKIREFLVVAKDLTPVFLSLETFTDGTILIPYPELHYDTNFTEASFIAQEVLKLVDYQVLSTEKGTLIRPIFKDIKDETPQQLIYRVVMTELRPLAEGIARDILEQYLPKDKDGKESSNNAG